jgi:hypothetical protein
MCLGKTMTGHMVIGEAKYFYDGMKVTDKCAFSEDNNKKLPVRTSAIIHPV